VSVFRSLLSRLAALAGGGTDDSAGAGTGTGNGRQRRSAGGDSDRPSPAPTDFPPGDPLREFGDRWKPAERGMHRFVVYPPADGPTTSIRRCSTLDETRQRLSFWYGEGAVGDGPDGRADDGRSE
jgi:hypothetical protein